MIFGYGMEICYWQVESKISDPNRIQDFVILCRITPQDVNWMKLTCVYMYIPTLVDPLTRPEVKIIEMAGSSFIDLENRPWMKVLFLIFEMKFRKV